MAVRAHSIEIEQDPETGGLSLDVEEAVNFAEDAIRTMYRFGGMLNVGVTRVDTGERIGGEPIMQTHGFHFFYNTSAPLARTPEAPAEPEQDATDEDEGDE